MEAARERLQFGLFVATGVAIPFFAFPVARPFGKPVDLATVLAALFVGVSLPALRKADRRTWAFVVGAALAPLTALLPPHDRPFDGGAFALSYAHWLLVSAFFVCALTVVRSCRDWTSWAGIHLVMGALVALFALYQLVGIPRHWPATGRILVPFQRVPLIFMKIGPGYVRPTSVFLEPALLGGYLAWVAASAIALLLGAVRRTLVILAIALALWAISLAVLVTASWSAYADLAVVLAALALAGRGEAGPHRRSRAFVLLATLALVLVVALGPGRRIVGHIAERARLLLATPLSEEALDPKARNSGTARAQNLRHTAELFVRHPVRGIGFGQLRRFAPDEGPTRQFFVDAWCGWVAIGTQAGVPGILVLAGAVLLAAPRRFGADARATKVAAAGLVALAVVQQLHTASYIDLWWWYPLAAAGAMRGGTAAETPNSAVSLSGSRTQAKGKE